VGDLSAQLRNNIIIHGKARREGKERFHKYFINHTKLSFNANVVENFAAIATL
jgi:hypothetical protein